MAEAAVPVSIGQTPSEPRSEVEEVSNIAEALGFGVAGMLRHLAAVLDREDRLEAGTGDWMPQFRDDPEARRGAVTQSILRALQLAVDPVNFTILGALAASGNRRTIDIVELIGLNQLSVSERISDLVSAGLATKIPEASQVGSTPAGVAIVELVTDATEAGARELGK